MPPPHVSKPKKLTVPTLPIPSHEMQDSFVLWGLHIFCMLFSSLLVNNYILFGWTMTKILKDLQVLNGWWEFVPMGLSCLLVLYNLYRWGKNWNLRVSTPVGRPESTICVSSFFNREPSEGFMPLLTGFKNSFLAVVLLTDLCFMAGQVMGGLVLLGLFLAVYLVWDLWVFTIILARERLSRYALLVSEGIIVEDGNGYSDLVKYKIGSCRTFPVSPYVCWTFTMIMRLASDTSPSQALYVHMDKTIKQPAFVMVSSKRQDMFSRIVKDVSDDDLYALLAWDLLAYNPFVPPVHLWSFYKLLVRVGWNVGWVLFWQTLYPMIQWVCFGSVIFSFMWFMGKAPGILYQEIFGSVNLYEVVSIVSLACVYLGFLKCIFQFYVWKCLALPLATVTAILSPLVVWAILGLGQVNVKQANGLSMLGMFFAVWIQIFWSFCDWIVYDITAYMTDYKRTEDLTSDLLKERFTVSWDPLYVAAPVLSKGHFSVLNRSRRWANYRLTVYSTCLFLIFCSALSTNWVREMEFASMHAEVSAFSFHACNHSVVFDPLSKTVYDWTGNTFQTNTLAYAIEKMWLFPDGKIDFVAGNRRDMLKSVYCGRENNSVTECPKNVSKDIPVALWLSNGWMPNDKKSVTYDPQLSHVEVYKDIKQLFSMYLLEQGFDWDQHMEEVYGELYMNVYYPDIVNNVGDFMDALNLNTRWKMTVVSFLLSEPVKAQVQWAMYKFTQMMSLYNPLDGVKLDSMVLEAMKKA